MFAGLFMAMIIVAAGPPLAATLLIGGTIVAGVDAMTDMRPSDDGYEVVPLCRPADVDEAELEIGELSFGADDYDAWIEIGPDARPALQVHLLHEDDMSALADLTTRIDGDFLPVKVRGEMLSAPIVMEPILGGQLKIDTDLRLDELQRLAEPIVRPCD